VVVGAVVAGEVVAGVVVVEAAPGGPVKLIEHGSSADSAVYSHVATGASAGAVAEAMS
jgi:hypothetical protein